MLTHHTCTCADFFPHPVCCRCGASITIADYQHLSEEELQKLMENAGLVYDEGTCTAT